MDEIMNIGHDRTQVKQAFQILVSNKDADLSTIAQLALQNEWLWSEILEGVVSNQDAFRFNCFKTLMLVCESQPERLYPKWERFVALLESPNTYHRSIAVNVLAGLVKADCEKRFDALFESYFALLDGESLILARYVAQNAGRIARLRRDLSVRITDKLLAIDQTPHEPGKRDLLKTDVIQSLEMIFADSPAQIQIIAFVHAQVHCTSPKTRQVARLFLQKYGQ